MGHAWFKPAGTASLPSTFAVLIILRFALVLLGNPENPSV